MIPAPFPPSYFLFVKRKHWGDQTHVIQTVSWLSGLFWVEKPFAHYCYYCVEINSQQYITLAIIVANGIIFNTFVWGYVYVHMCVRVYVYIKHGLEARNINQESLIIAEIY